MKMRLPIVIGAMVSLLGAGGTALAAGGAAPVKPTAVAAAAPANEPNPLPPLFVPPAPINPITEFIHEIVAGSVLDTQPAPQPSLPAKAEASSPAAQTPVRAASRR